MHQLEAAVEGKNFEGLTAYLSKAAEMGLESAQFPTVGVASKLRAELEAQAQACAGLRAATTAGVLVDLEVPRAEPV